MPIGLPAGLVLAEFGDDLKNHWLGYYRFKKMLNAFVPEARTDSRGPGNVLPL
jgi:hypothetical protein